MDLQFSPAAEADLGQTIAVIIRDIGALLSSSYSHLLRRDAETPGYALAVSSVLIIA
ncbi:hypothetical protein [Novosphingobium sp. BW1]|uniref:hypothetical protein n=1 Tax=Novosphingobium sp. BW1 TaxID=2592621 RepID=UPI001293B11B|nr:hypothetical protein [Novosphingobium sp. BW1]